jgi:small conductance mechanosensitive channel
MLASLTVVLTGSATEEAGDTAAEALEDFQLPENVWELGFSALRILLILVLAYIAQRLAKRLIRRLVSSMQEEGVERLSKTRSRAPLADTRPVNLARATMRTETIGGVLRSIATFTVWAIAVLMILGEIGVSLGPLIAGAGIVGVALGFGAQQLVQDFLSGLFMLLEDQYGIGDYIDADQAEGTVEGISLRTTRLRDIYGIVWHVPNGEIRRVGNHSQEYARALLDIGIAYGSDIDKAAGIMKREVDRMAGEEQSSEQILEEGEIWGVQDLGDSAVLIRMVVKVAPLTQWRVMRELRRRVKYAFDREGVEIPFPQRAVWPRGPQPSGAGDESPIWEPAGRADR